MTEKEVLELLQTDENRVKYGLSELNVITITRWLANMKPVERAVASFWTYYENNPSYAAIVVDDFFGLKRSEESFDANIHFSTSNDLRDFLERAFANTESRVDFQRADLVGSDMSVFYLCENGLIRMSEGENGTIVVEYSLDEE